MADFLSLIVIAKGLSKDFHPEGGGGGYYEKVDENGHGRGGGFWNTLNTEYLEGF